MIRNICYDDAIGAPDPELCYPSGSKPDPDTLDPVSIQIRPGSTKFTGYPARSGSGSSAPLDDVV